LLGVLKKLVLRKVELMVFVVVLPASTDNNDVSKIHRQQLKLLLIVAKCLKVNVDCVMRPAKQ
jgi:hypothetical protein